MSSTIKKIGKHVKRGPLGSKEKLRKFSSQTLEPRKGAASKARAATALAQRQQQLEKTRAAEAESEIALRRVGAGQKSGRRSLIKSSPVGLATNLGGTA